MSRSTSLPASAITSGIIDNERLPSVAFIKTLTSSVQASIALSEFGDFQIAKLRQITSFTGNTKIFWLSTVAHLSSSTFGTIRTSTGYARVIRWDGTLAAQIGTGNPNDYINVNIGTTPTAQYNIYPIPMGIMPVANGGSVPSGDITGINMSSPTPQIISVYTKSLSSLTDTILNNNLLTNVDLSGCTSLINLQLANNSITSINLTGLLNLDFVFMNNNLLASINLSGCVVLKTIHLNDNLLTSVDFTAVPSLEYFTANNNRLVSLDISSCTNLNYMEATNNQIGGHIETNINNSTAFLILDNNRIESIQCHKRNTNVLVLFASNNKLKSLVVPPHTGVGPGDTQLRLSNNQIVSLDFSNSPRLFMVQIDGNPYGPTLDLSAYPHVREITCHNTLIETVIFPSAAIQVSGFLGTNYHFHRSSIDGPVNVPILQTEAGVNSIYNGLPNRVGLSQGTVYVGSSITLGDPSIATAKNYQVLEG
jgi:hypothetical protein